MQVQSSGGVTPRTESYDRQANPISAPAARLSHIGFTTRPMAPPATTAIADVATSAAAEPMKIVQRDVPPAASDQICRTVQSTVSVLSSGLAG